MMVERILKELTPERIKKEVENIKNVKLPPELQRWVDEYEKVGGRDGFIWKLFLKIKDFSYIPIDVSYLIHFEEAKFLITMFVVLMDDIADQNKNKKLLDELLNIPFAYKKNYIKINELNQKEKLYLKFTIKVWKRINQLIRKFPEYKKFKEIFLYDIKQIINAMEYDYLINQNHYLINKTESWLYAPNTMKFITALTINLMCLSDFDMQELSIIREIAWQAQKMARIGNWIGTWEREIKEKDFTSGIFAYAVNLNILNVKELESINRSEIVKKIKKAKIENELLKSWEGCYKKILKFTGKVKTIKIKSTLHDLKHLLALEMINKKYK